MGVFEPKVQGSLSILYALSTPGVYMHRSSRTGAVAVEMAVVLPLFMLIVFGIVEFGRGMMVKQLLANSARLGARRSILEGKTNSEIKALVKASCQNTISPTASPTVTISINGVTSANLETANEGDLCEVSVSVPFTQVSLLPTPKWMSTGTLNAKCTMEHE
jgi:Flp pilus assembly protein TadG